MKIKIENETRFCGNAQIFYEFHEYSSKQIQTICLKLNCLFFCALVFQFFVDIFSV